MAAAAALTATAPTTSRRRRMLVGDHAHARRNHPLHRLAGLGIARQGRRVNRLPDFEATRLHSGLLRDRLVNVGRHGRWIRRAEMKMDFGRTQIRNAIAAGIAPRAADVRLAPAADRIFWFRSRPQCL